MEKGALAFCPIPAHQLFGTPASPYPVSWMAYICIHKETPGPNRGSLQNVCLQPLPSDPQGVEPSQARPSSITFNI
jgi:hypothetical protein